MFTEVVEDIGVVDRTKGTSTGRNGIHRDVSKKDVIIENVTVSE